jgi:hypothetical protein
MTEVVKKEYTTKIDSKNRLTIRGAKHSFFKVKVFNTGKVILNPQILVDPDEIPSKTLKTIEASVRNYKKGKVSKPVNISKYK